MRLGPGVAMWPTALPLLPWPPVLRRGAVLSPLQEGAPGWAAARRTGPL